MKNSGYKKVITPSQRESITGFFSKFGTNFKFEEKAGRRKAARIIIIILCLLAFAYIGFFITDVIIRFSEVPYEAHISGEGSLAWILYPLIQD